MNNIKQLISAYLFPVVLLLSILAGGFAGLFLGPHASYLKPLGTIFINLIYTAIVPLIFFSIASAIANTNSLNRLGTILTKMMLVFILTSTLAALYSLAIVSIYPPAQGAHFSLALPEKTSNVNLSEQVITMFTVPEFLQLFSHQHILALIIFSALVGIAVVQTKETSHVFKQFLQAGETIFIRVFHLIMYFAPLGFFAYFAVLVEEIGPKIIENYLRIAILYYVAAALYFILAYTLFAYIARGKQGIALFWKHIFLPAMTSWATCSSAASIPANLVATRKMNVSGEICDTVIPLGSLIHKDGSVIGGVFKIAFLFGIFQLDFTGASVLLTALGVSLLVGTVMGAIPSGGMLGELLILDVYGFPPSSLIIIAAISIIIDPLATMLNVTGNSVSSMLVARFVDDKDEVLLV